MVCRVARAVRRVALVSLFVALAPGLALAHQQAGTAGGLVSGFLHPVLGPDHVIAMIAVGLWGVQLGRPAIWTLPITFPLIMAFGGMMGVAGIPLPSVEVGIALSAVVLGIMVAGSVRPQLWVVMAIVGTFAIFHGHAHGTELPHAADPLAYGVGFVVATGLLHLSGILVGLAIARPLGVRAVQACGVLIAVLGGYFLVNAVGVAA
jgi:urease accessory protein